MPSPQPGFSANRWSSDRFQIEQGNDLLHYPGARRIKKDNTAVLFLFYLSLYVGFICVCDQRFLNRPTSPLSRWEISWLLTVCCFICSIDDTRLTALSATFVTPLALSSTAVEMSFSPVVIALIVSRISPVFLENSLLPIAAPFPV